MQRVVTEAVREAGIAKRASCYTIRHSFATHLLEDGYDIRAILKGPSGQADLLVSVWFVRVGEDSPQFVTASGRTQALVTMKETDVRAVADNDLVAVRQTTIRGDLRLRVR